MSLYVGERLVENWNKYILKKNCASSWFLQELNQVARSTQHKIK